jgi:16S rRNA (guanine966-N2)-methyltransferase
MRIISGKFKGRKLAQFSEDHLRPTTDRVKESLFNIIAGHIEGARALDLFSGTGNLGFEALSRGAGEVHMVELSKRSIQIIQQNAKLLGIASDPSLTLHKADALKFVGSYDAEPFGVVLIDPPFPLKVCVKILEALEKSLVIDNDSIIVIEHSVHEAVPEKLNSLTRVDTRDYGDKLLAFYKKDP